MMAGIVQRLRTAGLKTRIAIAAVGALLLGVGLVSLLGRGTADDTGAVESTGTAKSTTSPKANETPEDSCSERPGAPDGADGWGGCWPGPTSTGVPAGTALRRVPGQMTSGDGWTWDAGDAIVTVTDDGAVLDGLDVAGGIVLRGIDVTIRDSRAHFVAMESGTPASYCHFEEGAAVRKLTGCTVVPGLSDNDDTTSNDPRASLEDSEIRLRGKDENGGTCISGRSIDVARVDVRGCVNGFDADSYMSITDSYVHDLFNSAVGDVHTDGLQSGVGAHLLLDHNVFYGFTTGCTFPNETGSCNGTSAINIGGQQDLATVRDTTVKRNLLAGGAYTMYCSYLPPSHFVVSQNYFSTVYSSTASDPSDRDRVGEFGPQSGCDGTGVTATGNTLFDYTDRTTAPLAFGAQ